MGTDGNDDPAAGAAPFQGTYVVEGAVLPIADSEADAAGFGASSSIEERLRRRRQKNSNSTSLAEDGTFFGDAPADRTSDDSASYQPTAIGGEHLDEFQSVYRKLRRTGRNEDDRDVSDSMKKAM